LPVFDRHEPWVCQHGTLGYQLDTIVNRKGESNLG